MGRAINGQLDEDLQLDRRSRGGFSISEYPEAVAGTRRRFETLLQAGLHRDLDESERVECTQAKEELLAAGVDLGAILEEHLTDELELADILMLDD